MLKGKNKYFNKKIEKDGIKFDSVAEYNIYLGFNQDLKQGKIKDLKVHYPLKIEINGHKIAKLLVDFAILDHNDTYSYYDVKGKGYKKYAACPASVFSLKCKLLKAIYDIDIKIIEV